MHVVLSSSMLSLEFDLWVTLCFCSLFFFFKQKTAYEMRISDWSSDVCSSDLKPDGSPSGIDNAEGFSVGGNIGFAGFTFGGSFADTKGNGSGGTDSAVSFDGRGYDVGVAYAFEAAEVRSEEHTSELQSLMRSSYAVFCLKNKTTTTTHTHICHRNNGEPHTRT